MGHVKPDRPVARPHSRTYACSVSNDFERMGGESVLRPLVDDFVGRMFDDVMIGYMFRQASRERVQRFEYQHAASFLGADVEYEGRPLDQAHRRHRIMGGQFARRKELLRRVLVEHGVDPDIQERWLAHVESLRKLITHDPGSECTSRSEDA